MADEQLNNAVTIDDLKREELLKGEKFGMHQLDAPITGYKKIHCARYERPWRKFHKELVCTEGLAKVEIPEKSLVIRPWTICAACDYFTGHAADKLRADNAIFQEYTFLQREKCPEFFKDVEKEMLNNFYCYSTYDNTSNYKWNESNRPEKFNTNIKDDRGGISFFFGSKWCRT